MALIACHECGKQISDTALACPACGARKAPPHTAPPIPAANITAIPGTHPAPVVPVVPIAPIVPMTVKLAGPVHIEKTCKSIKVHVLIGQMLTALGFLWLLYAGAHPPDDYTDPAHTSHPFLIPGIIITLGFITWGTGDWRRWWHHE